MAFSRVSTIFWYGIRGEGSAKVVVGVCPQAATATGYSATTGALQFQAGIGVYDAGVATTAAGHEKRTSHTHVACGVARSVGMGPFMTVRAQIGTASRTYEACSLQILRISSGLRAACFANDHDVIRAERGQFAAVAPIRVAHLVQAVGSFASTLDAA